MKKLILILVIFAGIQASGRPLVYNHVDFKYTPFIYSVCDELGIDNGKIFIQRTELSVQGFIQKTEFGYIIFIGKPEDVEQTIAHELVHIWQDIQGRWDVNVATTITRDYANFFVSEKARVIEYEALILSRKLSFKYD